MTRNFIVSITGIVGGFITQLFGGWDAGLQTLLLYMAMDYVTGLLTAAVFHNSPKTPNGALESKAGFKGLCRKGIALFIILIAVRLDLLLHTQIIRNTVVIAFICNESISILENAGLMGVPIPKKLLEAIELLEKDSGADQKSENSEE